MAQQWPAQPPSRHPTYAEGTRKKRARHGSKHGDTAASKARKSRKDVSFEEHGEVARLAYVKPPRLILQVARSEAGMCPPAHKEASKISEKCHTQQAGTQGKHQTTNNPPTVSFPEVNIIHDQTQRRVCAHAHIDTKFSRPVITITGVRRKRNSTSTSITGGRCGWEGCVKKSIKISTAPALPRVRTDRQRQHALHPAPQRLRFRPLQVYPPNPTIGRD